MEQFMYTFKDALDFGDSSSGVLQFKGCLGLFVNNKR